MTSENNIFSFGEIADPVEKARATLRAARQYQQDWQEHGVDRVHKYFDDVEGSWLEEFDVFHANGLLEQSSGVSFSDIWAKLKSLGLSSSFIEKIAFPSWWKSELRDDSNSVSQLLYSLVNRKFLTVEFSQEVGESLLGFPPAFAPKFKLQKSQENPRLFSFLAQTVANTVLETIEQPYLPISCDASIIRQAILQRKSCVNLESLLDFCWQSGIAVIHFDKKPDGHVKADGLVVMTNSRPVVVIGSAWKYSAWLLFILAHELGHIAHGHLQEGILADESFKDGVNDEEEEAANQFAAQLLLGNFSPQWPNNLNQKTLLTKARRLSEEHNLDPGALILNYARQTGNWGCAVGALKHLQPHADAPAQINTYYQHHLVKVDDESRDYLQRVNVLAA